MAQVIVTFKIMPDGVDSDLDFIAKESEKLILDFGGKVGKTEFEPVAFGLKAVKLFFVMDESKGTTDEVEEKISSINGVSTIEVVDVRRTVG